MIKEKMAYRFATDTLQTIYSEGWGTYIHPSNSNHGVEMEYRIIFYASTQALHRHDELHDTTLDWLALLGQDEGVKLVKE